VSASAPTELQLDALRELANVGCGRAADALSGLLGGRVVSIDVPFVRPLPPGDIPGLSDGEAQRMVAARLLLAGDLSGELLLVFSEKDAREWCALMLGRPAGDRLTDDERSALSESANIAASACLSALGTLTGFRLLPSVPHLFQVGWEARCDRLQAEATEDAPKLVLSTRLYVRGPLALEGRLVLIPDRASTKLLLERLGV
jgi:chemotaxis protein CheC